MRKPIIAGNWKMNKTPEEAAQLVRDLIPLVKDAKCDVVVCPCRQRGSDTGDPDRTEDDDLLRRAEGVVKGVASDGVDEADHDHRGKQDRTEILDNQRHNIVDLTVDL